MVRARGGRQRRDGQRLRGLRDEVERGAVGEATGGSGLQWQVEGAGLESAARMTVFLAFVLFAELLKTPPVIVRSYRLFDDCVTDARRLNKELEAELLQADAGFV